MRILVILRGPSRSGRSRFVHEQGLRPWHIDQRQLELALTDPVTTSNGALGPDRYHRARARERILAIVSEKITRGALVVFEPVDTGAPSGRQTVAASDKLLTEIVEQAQAYRYRVIVVDFAAISDDELGRLHALDTTPSPFTAPLNAVLRSAAHMRRPIGMKRIDGIEWRRPEDFRGISLLDQVEPPVFDISAYENVVAIGDIHGCYHTLRKLLDAPDPRPDTAYVFLGDFINKGPRSGKVLRFLAEHYAPAPNVFLLGGNHERALEDWVHAQPISKKAFTTTTLPDFERRKYRKREARVFLSHLLDAARFNWRGLTILATHGGFARPPQRLAILSSEHLQHGTENSAFDIDAAWEAGVLAGDTPDSAQLVQVHGHRNPNLLPVYAGIGSFNLEGGVDTGGNLRAVLFRAPETAGGRCRVNALEVANAENARRAGVPGRLPDARPVASLGEVL